MQKVVVQAKTGSHKHSKHEKNRILRIIARLLMPKNLVQQSRPRPTCGSIASVERIKKL